jgi:low temperature requirement protein LtrA
LLDQGDRRALGVGHRREAPCRTSCPTEELPSAELIAVVGGPALYLLAQAALRLRMTGGISYRRLTGAIACVAIGLVGTGVPALVVGALLVAVLVSVIVADEIAGLRRAASGPGVAP